MNFGNKKIIIMGLGSYKDGSGISAALFFAKKGANLLITDLKTKKELASQIKRLESFFLARTGLARIEGSKERLLTRTKYVLGRHRMQDFREADYIFKNPSVPKNSPYLKIAKKNKIPIINDWTIFFEERPQNLVIGVTGTKGKSTTATLIYQLLKNARKDATLCGNIGQSPLSILNKIKKPRGIEKINSIKNHRSDEFYTIGNFGKNKSLRDEGTIVVAELSSWLLHEFKDIKQSPRIAVITNLMPDHLDKYKNIKEYYKDKENIFRFQNKNDYLILNENDKNLRKIARKSKSRIVWYDGAHQNAAIAVAKLLKIPKSVAERAIKTFKGLSGRLEFIRGKNGVKYYNDTTATTPDATIYSLKSLSKYKGKIILISGGMDKNLDYKRLATEIPKYCKALILFKGTASEKIIKELLKLSKSDFNILNRVSDCSSMKKAVETAKKIASKDDIILLSPASTSFNMFKNEFDRGEQFNRFVKRLK
ncbi:MAG: hypothetical protein COV90_01640 [Candidatus Tagabacteria bacterium CG11_big_fil_rev_8_21_14_0_20_41_11]|nr:MAG: hypothetical protein COV90_01640 [Candidatus Tagabacteria bacterium CG11_big_fil_rev_8_21_14_0_20_41_11]